MLSFAVLFIAAVYSFVIVLEIWFFDFLKRLAYPWFIVARKCNAQEERRVEN